MRTVIQRVEQAKVYINSKLHSSVNRGLLIFLGITTDDGEEDINWLCKKISGLRIFADNNQKMNLSVVDTDGEIMVISQFTLYANIKKGNRPSYTKAATPEIAIPLYQQFIDTLAQQLNQKIKTGQFGADMNIELINSGPVTIMMDSKDR
ncbi:MAG: D-aminoacyl-tRNA deacylase [Endozoicomonadaceae bacterium]|nr:D-aminoacyl-tRNA deacylase [Endozoicomonadaceae bacterium]MCY4304075.1 D-aminoacyl-tRNA deacylase [Aestuariivita sp.]